MIYSFLLAQAVLGARPSAAEGDAGVVYGKLDGRRGPSYADQDLLDEALEGFDDASLTVEDLRDMRLALLTEDDEEEFIPDIEETESTSTQAAAPSAATGGSEGTGKAGSTIQEAAQGSGVAVLTERPTRFDM